MFGTLGLQAVHNGTHTNTATDRLMRTHTPTHCSAANGVGVTAYASWRASQHRERDEQMIMNATKRRGVHSYLHAQLGLTPGAKCYDTVPAQRVLLSLDRLVGQVVKASASRAEDPEFESHLRRDFFFGVESYQWLKNWHSSGYPARRLAL